MSNLSLISKINKYDEDDFIEHFYENNDVDMEIEEDDSEFKERCFNVILIIFILFLIFLITKNE
tara:strand:+ start:215 stop:406 length:192 start_codon:yes stop_codon:yes gene_type:complete